MGIRLSKKHGVNPALGLCPRCGKENGEVLLIGAARTHKCSVCGTKFIGKRPGSCLKCGASNFIDLGEFDSSVDRYVTSAGLCDACKKEVDLLKEEVANGGVPIRCKDCGMEGVLKADHPMAIEFRKGHPDEGLEIGSDQCPLCGKE